MQAFQGAKRLFGMDTRVWRGACYPESSKPLRSVVGVGRSEVHSCKEEFSKPRMICDATFFFQTRALVSIGCIWKACRRFDEGCW